MATAAAIHFAVVGGAALYARSRAPIPTQAPGGWLDLSLIDTPEPLALPPTDVPTTPEPPSATGGTRLAVRVPSPVVPNPGESGREGTGALLDGSGTDPTGIPGGRGSGASGAGEGGAGAGSGKGTGKRPINIGIDRGMTWLWTQPERPAPKPRPASTTGGLQESLDAHDRRLGLGFGGPVVSAFHSAAALPSAPQNGQARFEAIIDASGRAISVNVLSVNGDAASWQAVAEQVLRMLRSRLLRVPLEGKGIAIVVDVRSRYQLPSGSAPGKAIEVKGAGAQFDLSDIGATPAHNVAVHVVTERRL